MIPLLGIYQRKLIQKDTHTSIFIAAFTIAKTWKQLKCLSTEEWRKKIWYTYTHKEILLSHKKNEIMPLYTEMTN